MPGLGDSKWASNPANDTPTQATTSNGNRTSTGRHTSVPSFGYSPPSGPTTKPNSSRSATKPPSRAEVAGKAAAKRMDELQGDSNAFNKVILYQKYGSPNTPQGHSSATPAIPPPRDAQQITKANEDQQTHLHRLFNQWVPRGDEFYNVYPTLSLNDQEIAAIQHEIINYRVQTAIAAGKGAVYTAPWETPRPYVGHSKHAPNPTQGGIRQDEDGKDADAMGVDPDDPLGLGLASSLMSKDKGRSGDAIDLMN